MTDISDVGSMDDLSNGAKDAAASTAGSISVNGLALRRGIVTDGLSAFSGPGALKKSATEARPSCSSLLPINRPAV